MFGILIFGLFVPPDSVTPLNLHWIDTIEDWKWGYMRKLEARIRVIYWTARPRARGFYRLSPDEVFISYSVSERFVTRVSEGVMIWTRWMCREDSGVVVSLEGPWKTEFLICNKKTRKYTNFYVIVSPPRGSLDLKGRKTESPSVLSK
ncbi:MAG: hypothetical protein ABIM46_09000 [candidate division WOR-3 bacterium]